MRYRMLALTLALGGMALPALAQPDPRTGARPGRVPGEGQSWPLSPYASNIAGGDTRSVIAPTLPTPDVADDASARQFLMAARTALAADRTGEAQEAMERAQTRLLDRATPLFQTDRPSDSPAVKQISMALQALGSGDRAGAAAAIEAALPMVE